MVQAILKKWWVESDFKAPNLPLSLRLKGSGCHYNNIYNSIYKSKMRNNDKSTFILLSEHLLFMFSLFQQIVSHIFLVDYLDNFIKLKLTERNSFFIPTKSPLTFLNNPSLFKAFSKPTRVCFTSSAEPSSFCIYNKQNEDEQAMIVAQMLHNIYHNRINHA